eukprot:CAMPEP_0198494688 /NCGR_PEP_ID=MMETSP1462-20131121/4766_1 /TAXON_ID=1333877 /ORGANISM="Brandtodinium nutriculum, Strain RCC3387" /LENGTH=297 /DNA_ID=CAMNT_0044223433 /DNA_START=41 /DNA_END=934 /DNA_ORIENTATION=+
MQQQMMAQMMAGQAGQGGAYAGGMYPAAPYPQQGGQAGAPKGGFQPGGEQQGRPMKGGMKGEKGEKGKGKSDGKGKGFGKGFGKSKGKGYGGYGGYDGGYGGGCMGCGDYGGPPNFATAWTPDSPEKEAAKQVGLAQRKAALRDKTAISQAQRNAQMRFEKDMYDKVQGTWIDEEDPTTCYTVEGSLCTVSGGENARVFRNRISMYNGELVWDARRFWHSLNLKDLPANKEDIKRLEWVLGQGSPQTRDIVWLRGSPPAAPSGEGVVKLIDFSADKDAAGDAAKKEESAGDAEAAKA